MEGSSLKRAVGMKRTARESQCCRRRLDPSRHMHDEANYEADQEQEEQNLGNCRKSGCRHSEPKDRRDYRDHEKYQRVM